MSLYEIIARYKNIEKLDNKIPPDIFKTSKLAITEEIILKVENIIEYRKKLLKEGKAAKLTELDEYIQYCFLIADIKNIRAEKYLLEILKPIENVGYQKKSINIKELFFMNLSIKEMEIIKCALAYYMDTAENIDCWEIEELWNLFNDRIEEINFLDFMDKHSEEEILKELGE